MCTTFLLQYDNKQNLRERKLSSSSSSSDAPSLSDGKSSCAELNGMRVEFTTSWELEEEDAVSYTCSDAYLPNFAANKNLLEDFKAAVGSCFKYCNVDNKNYVSGNNASGSGDLSDLFDDDGKTCDAIAANAGASADVKVKGPTSCTCEYESPGDDVSGCSSCEGTVTAGIVTCYDVAP